MGGIAIGLCVGYIASLCLGMVDFSSMRNLPLITIPHPFKYGFSFSFHQFLVVGTIYLLSVLEAVGDITATAMVSRRPKRKYCGIFFSSANCSFTRFPRSARFKV